VTRNADVSIVLTSSQLAQVARAASPEDRGVASLLSTFGNLGAASQILDAADTANVSRSVLRALLVLSAFPLDGAHRALADVANELGYNPSTTHRYVGTWLAIGLLEQDPKSRKYRRPSSPTRPTPE
jgi:IclR helix-turn-helix domain